MPTPYDLYVRFLVTKGEDDVTSVNTRLQELNLPEINQAVFDAQYGLVMSAVPGGVASQIESKNYSVDFPKWMEVLQVAELWDYERTRFTGNDPVRRGRCKLVYDVHHDPQLRVSINALLIKGLPHKEIAQPINARYSALLQEEHLALYERFFFNPRLMTRKSWRQYLKGCSASEAAVYFTALSSTIDVVKNELELPSTISTAETLQFLLSKAVGKARDFLSVKTPEGGEEARKWIHTVLQLTDKYEKYRTGDTEDFAKSLQMEFAFIEGEFLNPDANVLSEIAAKAKLPEDEKDTPADGDTK